jgi:membrane protein DedA with SNARE-associated domain
MFEELIARFGYLAVLIGTFFEGEAVLVAAGAFAHRGLLSLPLVMLTATLGSTLGDQLWFQLGRRYGRPFLERRPTWQARARIVQPHIERHGDLVVLGFRFAYGVRTVTPALRGMSGYPALRFACLNLIGSIVWAVVVGAGGWALGAALTGMLERAAHVEELIAAAVAGVGAVWLVVRLIRRRRAR